MLIINNFFNLLIVSLVKFFNFFVYVIIIFSLEFLKIFEDFNIFLVSKNWYNDFLISVILLSVFFLLTLLISNNNIKFNANNVIFIFFIFLLIKNFFSFVKTSLINSLLYLNFYNSNLYLNSSSNFFTENINSENFVLNSIFFFIITSFFIWFLSLNKENSNLNKNNFNWIIIIFFFIITSFFLQQISSLFIFYVIVECNSIFFFILLFSNKNIENNSLLKFYGIIFNVIGSLFMLGALGIFYFNTGSFQCNIELIETALFSANQNFWLIGFYSCFLFFILFKIGFFLTFPVYVNFYSSISLESIMYSIILLKTIILWFFIQNFFFFCKIIKLIENNCNWVNVCLLWLFVISVLIGIYFLKFFSKINSNLILYISNYISGLLVFSTLFFSNMSEVVVLYTILIYYFLSTLILFLALNVSSYKEFIFIILFYLGFPGILFFIKLNLFSILLISKFNFIGIIIFVSVIFMLFLQEFFFSINKFNNNLNCLWILNNKASSNFINFFSLITILSFTL